MKRETKEFDFSSLTALLRSLSKSVQAATRRSRQKKLLGSFANNFFVFQFCIMKFGDNTKSTMGYNPVTLFFRKKIFFLKNFGRFSHKGGPLPPKTKKNHIRGDPYLRNHIFSRSWKDVWFDCKRFISYQKHRESRECRIEKSLTFHKLETIFT